MHDVNSERSKNALAYTAGTCAHALITSLFFLWSYGDQYFALSLFAPTLLVFLLPVIPTLTDLHAARPGTTIACLACAVAIAWWIAVSAAGFVLAVVQLHLLIPAALFALFSFRYWRAVAPMVFILMGVGTLGWRPGLELARSWFEPGSVGPGIFRLTGFAIGCAAGWLVLRWGSRLYRAKAYSDQELFIDTWWALFTLIQTALFVVKGGLVMVFSVCAFLAYWLIKRGMLKRAASAPAHTPRNLLLLRVFGHDARTERLLDDVGLRWRHLGTIQMIAGRDLAARNLDPHEFVAFLGGALAREFVKNEDDLRRRIAAMDRQPDVDGRYRVNQFFCHQNTWRAALNASRGALGRHSDGLARLRRKTLRLSLRAGAARVASGCETDRLLNR